MRNLFLAILALFVGGFLLIQLVPYGRNHNNPPITNEVSWPSPEAKALAKRACYDCHSNETEWTWYSNIAPISWLVQHDVEEGREHLNFSEWGNGRREGEESEELVESVQEGKMPLQIYLITHPEGQLTDTEKQQLLQALQSINTKN